MDCPLQHRPCTQQHWAACSQLVNTSNSKYSQTKFNNNCAQTGPWRLGHRLHLPGSCVPSGLSQKVHSALKTHYLSMMFSQIIGVGTFLPTSHRSNDLSTIKKLSFGLRITLKGLKSVESSLHTTRNQRFYPLTAQSVGKESQNLDYSDIYPLPRCKWRYVKVSSTKPKDNEHPGLAIYSSHGTTKWTRNRCSPYIPQVKRPRLQSRPSFSSYCKRRRKVQLFYII